MGRRGAAAASERHCGVAKAQASPENKPPSNIPGAREGAFPRRERSADAAIAVKNNSIGIKGKRMRLGKFSHMAVATLAIATLATGCASSGGDEADAAAPTNGGEFVDNSGGDTSGMTSEGTRGLLESVYFDYDSSAIRSDQRSVLQGNASKIGQNAGWRMVVVEGHCDERGSEEYNLALGERRANAVREYLTSRGIAASRLNSVSYGEERPKHDNAREETRRLNRRAALVVRLQQP
jgi:peptidoglycan-associated lipoprotein